MWQTALAASARLATSLREYLLPPKRLAALSPANRLKLLRNHLSRLQNRLSASAPRQNETDQMLREVSGLASEPESQPAAFGGSNALASVPMPSCTNACAVQPPKLRRDSRQPARVASEDSEPASQPGERNALASDPNLPKPSKIKNMAMQCSRLTFVGGATVWRRCLHLKHPSGPSLHSLHAPLWVIKPVHREFHVSGTSW